MNRITECPWCNYYRDEIDRLTRKSEVALADFKMLSACATCKYDSVDDEEPPCSECLPPDRSQYVRRGLETAE